MENEKVKIGPKLSDSEFFSELDCSVPGVSEAVDLFRGGDVAGAYSAFASAIRKLLLNDGYFKNSKPEKLTEELRERAEMAVKHIMVSVGVPMEFGDEIDWYANPTSNCYAEWTWQLSRHGEIQALARAYRVSGDERYAKEAAFLFDSWLRQAICSPYDDTPYHCDMAWRTIEAGIRMQHWPFDIHAFIGSPYFTDELLVKIFKSGYDHPMRITSKYTHGNWLFIELGGMARLVGGLPVFKKNGQWLEGIIEKISVCVITQVYPDSAQYELAPSYQWVAMNCAMSVERALFESGIKMPDVFYSQMRKMNEFFVKARMADGTVPPINDSPACDSAGTVKKFLDLYGGSENAKWIATGGKEGERPDYNSCVLPYAGFVAFRTGWGDEDVSAFFDGGKLGRDHQHEDRLNFLVYSAKRPLVYEMGTYAYDDSPLRRFAIRSQGHNVVTINGLGQNRLAAKIWIDDAYLPIKEDLRYYSEGDIEYAFAYYNNLWGDPKYDGESVMPKHLAVHGRSIIMIKGATPRDTVFIAYDRMMTNSDKKTYRALWHLNVEEVEEIEGGYTCPELTVLTGGFDSAKCYTGVMEPEPLGWIARSNIQGDHYAAPQLVLERCGSCESFVTLFAFGHSSEIPVSGVRCDKGSVTVIYKDGTERYIDVTYLDGKATIQ